ncbi:DUF7546 family protein [Salinigranum marinum]|uniref:DUF7546 family protein n=1 Tax=Salinigranum marinum TaxID=1515595 RepID=UPI002989D070|nr:hypothetical protein [Salinigranum marinum]
MSYGTRSVGGSDWLHRPEAWWLACLLVVETVGLVGYFALTNAEVQAVRYVLYPFVWINVGVLAVVHVTPRATSRRVRLGATAVAAGYFVVLGLLAGLVSVDTAALLGGGHGHSHAHVHGVQVAMTAPGWGPRVGYAGSVLTVNLVPFRVIGYLALSYLVYAALCDLAGTALSGVLGFGSCLSCLPVFGSFAAGLAGGTGVVTALSALSVDVSTAVFVTSVLVLAIRPTRDAS